MIERSAKSVKEKFEEFLKMERKGFEMPISAVIAIILGVLFVSAYWAAASGYFEVGVEQATELAEGIN